MTRPGSSLWRLAGMMFSVVAAALLLMTGLTTWALHSSLDAIARAVILDDLGEYEVVYNNEGTKGVQDAFRAGVHTGQQLLTFFDLKGDPALAVEVPGHPEVVQFISNRIVHPGDTYWISTPKNKDGSRVLLGCRGLRDGGQLWFGRTDTEDRALIARIQRLLLVAALVSAILSVAPIVWFASSVLRPVRNLIEGAGRLARSDRLDTRLGTSTTHTIPELIEFADAFNACLDRAEILTEELEAANDQLAHELRTPLARVRGNLESGLVSRDVDAIQEAAVRGIGEIDRAVALIQTILGIRAGEARSMRLHLEPVQIGKMLLELVELYQPAAEARGISLTFDAGEDLTLALDEQRIRQAVSNLLDNALAYTPSGGKVQTKFEIAQSDVLILVRDSGPGLTQQDLDQIWRRFSRGSAASAESPGIGLGLSLVRAIAKAHQGDASGKSIPGGGSEFEIRLPRNRELAIPTGFRH